MTATTGFRSRDLSSPMRHVDLILFGATLLIGAIGLIMVYGASRRFPGGESFVAKQMAFMVLGVVLMAALALIDYRRIMDWWQVIYGLSLIVLGGVLTPLGSLGDYGTKGWYVFGPIVFQPVEIAKLATIIAVAAYLGSAERIDLRRLGGALLLFALPMGLTLLQPDLGSSLVFIVVGAGMLVTSGANLRYLGILALIGVIGVAGVLSSDVLDDYQRDRLTAFANPEGVSAEARYNVEQAQTAISSGGLTGYGFGNGPSTRLGYVPAQRTDFIFTVAGEEFGFLGAGSLLVLYGVMVWRIWRTARIARDAAGMLLSVGVMSMLMFHIFENVGMNLGIMPITGIPLPLVSQGGSAVVATCVAVGLVQSVHMHRYT